MPSQENLIKLECTVCHAVINRTYKNKKKLKNRLELRKFCKDCTKTTLHKETK